jgi:TM2 domain-containing membrane protein YozV
MNEVKGDNQVGTSYLLWLGSMFGVAGLHRFYNKKFATGTLWLLTWGLFGVGQFVDLFLIPNMVEEHNLKIRARLGYSPFGGFLNQSVIQEVLRSQGNASATLPLTRDQLMIKLLKAAQTRGGKLTVTQGVLETEASFAEVEAVLREMVKTGYVHIDNDPVTGVVVYEFREL